LRLLLDENMSSRRLAVRLRSAGHSVELATDAGLLSVTDARVFAHAIVEGRQVLTRDHEDFADLHDLILVAGGRHSGILVVRFDNTPRNNLTDEAVVIALENLASSGISLDDQIHVLNHWR
jgi:predicted nuclease of predicted toxin-antitoxin system